MAVCITQLVHIALYPGCKLSPPTRPGHKAIGKYPSKKKLALVLATCKRFCGAHNLMQIVIYEINVGDSL